MIVYMQTVQKKQRQYSIKHISLYYGESNAVLAIQICLYFFLVNCINLYCMFKSKLTTKTIAHSSAFRLHIFFDGHSLYNLLIITIDNKTNITIIKMLTMEHMTLVVLKECSYSY